MSVSPDVNTATLAIAACLPLAPFAQAGRVPIQVPPGIQQERCVYCPLPVYPPLAIQARIQGTVELAALIDETGRVAALRLLRGHPFLVNAAFDAARRWRYAPAAWPVITTITVTFSLGIPESPPGVEVIRV